MNPATSQNLRPVIAWLAVVCLLIVAMVAVGGITRLTDSGLSMVDWKPLMGVLPPVGDMAWNEAFEAYQATPQYQWVNQDMILAEFKGIFWWEYVHRLIARGLAVVYLLPLVVFVVQGRVRGALALHLWFGFLLGGLQGLMGWYMVKSGLVDVPHVSHLRLAAHLALALVLFGYLFWIMCGLIAREKEMEFIPLPRLRTALIVFAVLLAVQTIYGAFMAGLRAGLAFNTFPKMLGFWIPPGLTALEPAWLNFHQNPTTVQFLHRGLGWTLGFAALGLWVTAWTLRMHPFQKRLLHGLMAMTLVQFALGVVTLVHAVPLVPAVLHQVGACVLLALSLALIRATGKGPAAEALPVPALDPVALPTDTALADLGAARKAGGPLS